MENQHDKEHRRIGAAWIKETRAKLAENAAFSELLDNDRRLHWMLEEMLVQKRQCSVRRMGKQLNLITVQADA